MDNNIFFLFMIAILVLIFFLLIIFNATKTEYFDVPRNAYEKCNKNEDCKGWIARKPWTLACCDGFCQTQYPYEGQTICPTRGYSDDRYEGETCNIHSDCGGWIAGTAGTLACCQGKCQKQLRDWAGIGYCPNECRGSPGGASGTCN